MELIVIISTAVTCWDLLRTHIFPRTRELPQFSISPKPLFLSKNRLRNSPKPVLKQNKKLCTYAQKKSLHICKVFGKKKVWGTRAMRRRQFYSVNGFVSGNRANDTGFSEKDQKALWSKLSKSSCKQPYYAVCEAQRTKDKTDVPIFLVRRVYRSNCTTFSLTYRGNAIDARLQTAVSSGLVY
ncbi:hypothetical protein LXL04_000159 [Taraxacum kok-saghyz]